MSALRGEICKIVARSLVNSAFSIVGKRPKTGTDLHKFDALVSPHLRFVPLECIVLIHLVTELCICLTKL